MKIKKFVSCNSFGMSGALALAVVSVASPVRGQQIFIGNDNGFAGLGSVGEYNADGSVINASLIPEGGVNLPGPMVVSGSDLFIANWNSSGSISEFTTSGTLVNASLVTGLSTPEGMTVSGNDLFVVNSGTGIIGEYTTSGATVNASLITSSGGPENIVVSGNYLFVANGGAGTISEYTTSGAAVNPVLVSGLSSPNALTISGNDLFVNTSTGVAEYTTSGAVVNASLITGINGGAITTMAIDGSELLVNQRSATAGAGAIYEYTLGATPGTISSSDTSFITGLYEPSGIAVIPVPEPVTPSLCGLGVLLALLRGRRVRP